MSNSQPNASPDYHHGAPNKHSELAETPEAEITAKGEAQTAAIAAAHERGLAAEADLQVMTEHVMDKADLEAGICFGVRVPNAMLPVEVAKLLCQIKNEKGLPVEKMPDVLIGKMLSTKISETSDIEVADSKVQATDRYARWLGQFDSNVEAAMAADTLDSGGNPKIEAMKRRLLGFQQILQIAEKNKADGKRIADAMNVLDFGDSAPEPLAFVHTHIFSSPEHDSGISEETQVAIAAEFNLTPRAIVTGSDYRDAMRTMKREPNGNLVPMFPESTPLKFRMGVEGFTSDDGQQEFMRATPQHGSAWKLDVTKFTVIEKGLAANLLELWAMTENAGETNFLASLTKIDLSVNNAIDPLALRDAAMIINATLGGFAGYNGEIFHGIDQIGIIQWQAQLRSPKGDAGRSDRNANMTDDTLKGLGIRDKHGNLNMDVLKTFGEYSRDNWIGAPDYEAARVYLAKLFPQKLSANDTTNALNAEA